VALRRQTARHGEPTGQEARGRMPSDQPAEDPGGVKPAAPSLAGRITHERMVQTKESWLLRRSCPGPGRPEPRGQATLRLRPMLQAKTRKAFALREGPAKQSVCFGATEKPVLPAGLPALGSQFRMLWARDITNISTKALAWRYLARSVGIECVVSSPGYVGMETREQPIDTCLVHRALNRAPRGGLARALEP